MAITKYHYNNHFFQNPLPCGSFMLLQVGEMYCDEGYVADKHAQSCFEITFVVDGEGKVGANDLELNLKKNDCFISVDGDVHSVASDKDNPLRFKFLAITPIDGDESELYIKHIYKYIAERRKINVPSLNERFLRIFDELENGLIFSSQAIGMEITAILIDIIRALEQKTQKRYPEKISNDNILVFHIISYLDNNVTKIKNLYELEEEFNYSYNYMSSIFKKLMNLSINDYFLQAKMNFAKKMLKKGLSVTEISEILNYSSVHTFSRGFKNTFGVSPIDFKTCEKLSKNID